MGKTALTVAALCLLAREKGAWMNGAKQAVLTADCDGERSLDGSAA